MRSDTVDGYSLLLLDVGPWIAGADGSLGEMRPRNNVDRRDWTLTLGEKIQAIEVDGYVVLPGVLDPEQVAELKNETAKLETRAVDYSVHQQYRSHIELEGGALTELIAHPPAVSFLRQLFGEEIVFMTYSYMRSEPGHPGISLHADGQPYGSKIFGYEGSCPWLVRVLYYLDDLTEDVSPFRIVPRSHLSMHADGNPYLRYERHPEELMVPVKAGSAVLINHRVFHGNYPNTGTRSRELLAIAYRPGWAGPVAEVDSWKQDDIKRLPSSVRPFFIDRNTRRGDFAGGNKPAQMPSEAPGINPSRWDLR